MAGRRRKIALMDRSPRAIGHYSAAEVGRLAGVSARRVGQWARYGVIPSVSSKPRVYSYADAAEAVLVRYLVEIGLKPREVRQIVEGLRTEYAEWPLVAAPLEHDGKLVVIHEGKNIYISALKPGHEVIAGTLIDLKAVRAALERGGWVTWKKPRNAHRSRSRAALRASDDTRPTRLDRSRRGHRRYPCRP